MIAVVDYGASNVQSVLRALRAVGAEAVLSADPAVVRGAARVVVPGVGHFAPAMRALNDTGLGDAVRETVSAGTPTLGICLGLQLFLEQSEEAPGVSGAGVAAGWSDAIPNLASGAARRVGAGRAHGAGPDAAGAGRRLRQT